MNGHEQLARSGRGEASGKAARGGQASATKSINVELDAVASAAAEARTALDGLAREVDVSVLDDARLLVSELVTNSVRHSGVPPHSRVRLVACARRDRLRVEVTDAGSGFEPSPRSPGQSHASGWGLYLVDRLADRWSVQTGAGTSVWFEIDRVSHCAAA